jgi:tetraacyldisaccharide 4'-kinase
MSAARRLLRPFALLYGGVIGVRNVYYDRWRGAVHSAAVPVISVGNLTVGGTGKTPLVIEIVRRLQSWGRRPAILTRGYQGTRSEPADEVLEFHDALPTTPVVVNRDRVAGAAAACAAHGADCLVLDDGFQHRRLARDLDLLLISAMGPPGIGTLLPAGRLREPLSSLRRADVLVITRCNQVEAGHVQAITVRLRRFAPDAPVIHAAVEPDALVAHDGQRLSPAELAGRRVLGVCGIGDPRTFVNSVRELSGAGSATEIFSDHHRYGADDVRTICAAAERNGAELVVTTRKDWVKLRPLWPDPAVPLVRLDVRFTLTAGSAEFDVRLRQALERRR